MTYNIRTFNVGNLLKRDKIHTQIYEEHEIYTKITDRHILIELQNTKDKYMILNSAKEKRKVPTKERSLFNSSFLMGT